MEKQAQKPEEQPPEEAVPPEWQVTVRRITKEDGRYLIYYDFAPAPEAPEIEIEPAETSPWRQADH